MIVGRVEQDGGGLYAYADVTVRGPSGHEINISALVDTGFNSFLSLPPRMVEYLGLLPLGTDDVVLANAETDTAFMFVGQAGWRHEMRGIPIHQIGDEPSVGTALLRSLNLSIDFVPNGDVRVRRI